jgi:hypothetical protein
MPGYGRKAHSLQGGLAFNLHYWEQNAPLRTVSGEQLFRKSFSTEILTRLIYLLTISGCFLASKVGFIADFKTLPTAIDSCQPNRSLHQWWFVDLDQQLSTLHGPYLFQYLTWLTFEGQFEG